MLCINSTCDLQTTEASYTSHICLVGKALQLTQRSPESQARYIGDVERKSAVGGN